MESTRTRKRCLRRPKLCLGYVFLSFYSGARENYCHGWVGSSNDSNRFRPMCHHHVATQSNSKQSILEATSTISAQEVEASTVYSSPLLNSATFTSEYLMDPLVNHPSIQLLDIEKRPRKKLKPRHKACFLSPSTNSTSDNPSPTLFEKLAVACCDSGVVPRKEFFETYAAARLIQDSFPNSVYRIADLAAGHGLLSWMLLAMDEYFEDGTRKDNAYRVQNRTAICIDRRMPPSAIAIAKSMRAHLLPLEETKKHPKKDDEAIHDDDAFLYDSRWTFVETDLGNVVVENASTLLVSVHACGTLSDYLIQMAISAKASLSLIPCCHTYSARKGYTPHPVFSGTTAEAVRTKIEDLQQQQQQQQQQQEGSSAEKPQKRSSKTHQKFQIVENVIDEVRWTTLRNAGYGNVRIASLPKEFTERNRLFLAHEQNSTDDRNLEHPMETPQTSETSVRKSIRKGSMPPSVENKGATPTGDLSQPPSFSVPIRDDPESIEECLSISGKAKAIERLRALLPNHFAPKLDVSMWLSPPLPDATASRTATTTTTTNVTVEALQDILDQVVRTYRHEQKLDKRFRCTISPINQVFVHPESGRSACIYQIEYSYESTSTIQESGEPFPKQVAKELHKSFCDKVVRCIDGTEIR